MSKTNVAVINVANEVKDGYGQLWNEKAGEAETKLVSAAANFLGKQMEE